MRTLGQIFKRPILPRPVIGRPDMSAAVQPLRSNSPTGKRMARIRRCEHDSEEFARTYLARHFSKDFCEFHEYIFKRIDAPAPPSGKREALIGPRKFGKTTIINLVLPLQELAYQRKNFVLLIGESSGAAEGNLATITQELETNELLLQDFPHLAPAIDPKGQMVKWTDRQLVLKNHSTIMAKGMATRMRGVKYRHRRPDLAILDDPESPETADTFLKRRRHKRWFGGTFLGLGTKEWDIWCIGNLPHYDALISDLVLSPEWTGIMFRAINVPRKKEDRYPIGNRRQDNSPLWPEEWPIDALEKYKRQPEVGALGFAREMMNEPREEEDKPFDPLKFAYFEFDPATPLRKRYVATAIAVDPAGGENPGEYRKGIRDFFVAVAGGRTKEGYIEVFDVVMTKAAPDEQIEKLLDMYDRHRTKRIGVEEVMFKNLYKPTIMRDARERGLYPTVTALKAPRVNKQTRILGVQPLIMDAPHIVRFAAHLRQSVPLFFAQFDEFPAGHDDAPDASEMLVRMLEKAKGRAVPTGVGGTSYWRKAS